MKRITWWPQIVLGLAFSWGALMGFAVMLGRIDAAAVALYAGSIAWVIGYDTIYAHQDAEDDALIGVKSTALLFGARTQSALIVFYALAVVLIGAALALAGTGWPAWIGLAAFAAHLVWQIRRLRDRRSRAVPASLQVQPRCGAAVVCRIACGCGDAGDLVSFARHQSRAMISRSSRWMLAGLSRSPPRRRTRNFGRRARMAL